MNPDKLTTEPEESSLEVGELYIRYKAYAFSIAYRMLGSVVEAEDVVQDCFAGLQSRSDEVIRHPKSYIAKLVVNRSLNLLNSARNQREHYVGEWLPEPIGEAVDLPEQTYEQKEMISYAYMVLLERLTPVERAVFVLREAFQYEYREIADWLGKTESNCRQIFSRARRNLPNQLPDKVQTTTDDANREKLLARFTTAFLAYDVTAMLDLLSEQPVFTADGGGRVHTVMRTMKVHKGVLALLTSRRVLTRLREREWVPTIINGEVQVALMNNGEISEVICLQSDLSGQRIEAVYLVVNPDKLKTIAAGGH
ncbi:MULTISPECIES: sigma-70 family RNA polymerase sigma factor [Paenibacillus]|uniref:sigma-70 family RNA polymerase sigma factor n=1 Tax=Paenibacillus TaxID=44249 RepID=UPI00129ECDF7|nr:MULTISPECIES: sigma-70 family RNA polymerase sigma factor [Paenibacillus]MBE7684446.1 sigma-70 family RNA polymerase sigma factor [Paenibacillus sp. P13VS]MCM3203938.1 sigma-70 family RNA polymerase sigma factor [Paenibacillus illinoisensis]